LSQSLKYFAARSAKAAASGNIFLFFFKLMLRKNKIQHAASLALWAKSNICSCEYSPQHSV
jgi:hypothetical protein